jgi:hypothetical protein
MPATRVSKLTQTCKGSPFQWEGLTDDGQFIYVRYRWGCLSIGSGKTMDEAVENANNLFEKSLGHKRDGSLEYAKLREATMGVVDWPESLKSKASNPNCRFLQERLH